MEDEAEQEERRERGAHQRRQQRVDDIEIARAIEPRGLDELIGDRQHRLPHEKGAERAGRERQNQAPHRVDQVKRAEREENGHEGDLRGYQQAREHQAEGDPATRELELGQRKPRGERERYLQERDGKGHHRGVDEIASEGQRREDLAVGRRNRAAWARARAAKRAARGAS